VSITPAIEGSARLLVRANMLTAHVPHFDFSQMQRSIDCIEAIE